MPRLWIAEHTETGEVGLVNGEIVGPGGEAKPADAGGIAFCLELFYKRGEVLNVVAALNDLDKR